MVCTKCVDAKDIATEAVTTVKIESGSVLTSRIDNQAVNAKKLASGAVSSAKIKKGAVTLSKVVPKLKNAIGTGCAPGKVVVGKVTETGNPNLGDVPLTVDADGSVSLADAQGDISMGIFGTP